MDGDPCSLDNMRDIVVGREVPWWPPAPAWYLVLAIAGLLAGLWTMRFVTRWHQNRYRRIAIKELSAMQIGDVRELSELLKRVALVSYPTEQVASLTGKPWADFLRLEVQGAQFGHPMTSPLETATSDPDPDVDSDTWRELLDDARCWILHHPGRRTQ